MKYNPEANDMDEAEYLCLIDAWVSNSENVFAGWINVAL